MIATLAAAAASFAVAMTLTPFAIRFLSDRDVGQFIQDEVDHDHKRGTPTMGGLVIMVAVLSGWVFGHFDPRSPEGTWQFGFREFQVPGLLVLVAFVGMGVIGFFDDISKVTKERNLGLNKRWKLAGQVLISSLFAWGAIGYGVNTELSFIRPLGFDLGFFYVFWVLIMLVATANAVNLADGLDGLASGSAGFVYGAFVIVAFWQFRHPDFYSNFGSLELAVMSAALAGAALGFLWWNAPPARIFMGDTGSQALGGAMAALALLTNTHLLLIVFGGLYVLETVSVILQVASFRTRGKRVFRMAPIHHHFELRGWPETTVIVRFWILAALFVVIGLGLFYGDFITGGGVG